MQALKKKFLEPSNKMFDGIVLTVGYNQSLFSLFFLPKDFSCGLTRI